MKTTIDTAGRLVVPKALRLALGLKPGLVLDAKAADGKLEVAIAPTSMVLKCKGKGVIAVAKRVLPTLTAGEVRETLERVRR